MRANYQLEQHNVIGAVWLSANIGACLKFQQTFKDLTEIDLDVFAANHYLLYTK